MEVELENNPPHSPHLFGAAFPSEPIRFELGIDFYA